jgi:hypothetical protein
MKKANLLACLALMLYGSIAAQNCPAPQFLGPDVDAYACPGDSVNLETYFFGLQNYTNFWTRCVDGTEICDVTLSDPTKAPAPGKYRLLSINQEGCTDRAYITVHVDPRPVGFVDRTYFICEGGTANFQDIYPSLSNCNPAPCTYLIDWGTPNPTAVGPGTYLVTVTTENGCVYQATVIVQAVPSENPALTNVKLYNMGGPQSSAFTTNLFRCLAVDPFSGVWAGTNSGGIYYFNGKVWTKKDPSGSGSDNKTYRELFVPEIVYDEPRVWAATSGDNSAYAVGGGIHLIKGISGGGRKVFTSSTYKYLALGPACFRILDEEKAGLSSRFATSLTRLGNFLYAGFTPSIDQELSCDGTTVVGTLNNGGVYQYDFTGSSPTWTKVENILAPQDDIKVTAMGTRGNQVWAAYQNGCFNNGTSCFEPFIGKYNTETGLPDGFVKSSNSPLPLSENPIIRAIFTDSRGNTFVGLSNGKGIGVLDPSGNWFLVNSQNSKLPSGASVNFNAIAEANDGRVFIGTSAGLLEYTGTGSFTFCSSYRLYTMTSGLPSNNVTDIAYSKIDGLIWLATDAGVCSVGDKIPSIRGFIAGVSAGKPGNAPEDLKLRPLPNVTVKVFQGGQDGPYLTEVVTDNQGFFSIPALSSTFNYRLSINYTFYPGLVAGTAQVVYPFNYLIKNLGIDTTLDVIPMPDSLLYDALLFPVSSHQPYVEQLKQEFAEFSIPIFTGPLTPKIGFDIDQYNMDRANSIHQVYSNTNLPLSADFMKRVRNVVAYYFLMQMMESGTKNSTKLGITSIDFFLDAIEYALKTQDVNIKWKMYQSKSDKQAEATNKINNYLIKLAGETILTFIRLVKVEAIRQDNANATKAVKQIEDITKYLVDFMAKTNIDFNAIKGAKTAAQGYGVDLAKKIIATTAGANLTLVANSIKFQSKMDAAATGALQLHYTSDYDFSYDLMRSKIDEMNSIQNTTLGQMETLKAAAKFAEIIETGAKYAKLVPSGAVGASLMALEKLAKYAQPVLYALGGVDGIFGTYLVFDEMEDGINRINLFQNRPVRNMHSSPAQISSVTIDTDIDEKKNRCNAALLQLRNTLPLNDSVAFFRALDTVLVRDSIFISSLFQNDKKLLPYIDSANVMIAGFDSLYRDYQGSKFLRRLQYDQSFGYLMQFYMLDSAVAPQIPYIQATIDTLMMYNDSAILGMRSMAGTINSNGIPAPAYLVNEVTYNYLNQPSQTGTVTVKYTNLGNMPLPNLRLKFLPDSLMRLNSPDSIFVGTMPPGDTRTFVWSVTTPARDTTATFTIKTLSDSGYTDDVFGMLMAFTRNKNSFTLKTGNWSDPTTWSTGEVPTEITEVQILHKVNVDINGKCKSLYSEVPGNLIINSGKNLTIIQ